MSRSKIQICGIYCIYNKITRMRYIGMANDIKHRWGDHKYQLRKNIHENIYLQRSWLKYGENNFSFSILEICDESSLAEKEKSYIKFYDSKAPNGYNLTSGGDGLINPSEETRKKMSEARKLRVTKDETRQKLSAVRKGVPKSEEHRKNISNGRKGIKRIQSEEERKTSSKVRQGKKKMKDSASKYAGVCFDKRIINNPWTAAITVRGEKHHLGCFHTEVEACMAYNEAAEFYYGKDAKLNIIPESELSALWSNCFDPENQLP